jgi:cell division protein FtsL
MHAPRRKTFNSVNAASLARWIVVTAFLALTGLIYVYLTLQLYHQGDEKKKLENELANLRTQNDVASVQIAALTSRAALQQRLKEGYLKMIPIAEQNIVRLNAVRPPRPEDTLQPVANKRGGR